METGNEILQYNSYEFQNYLDSTIPRNQELCISGEGRQSQYNIDETSISGEYTSLLLDQIRNSQEEQHYSKIFQSHYVSYTQLLIGNESTEDAMETGADTTYYTEGQTSIFHDMNLLEEDNRWNLPGNNDMIRINDFGDHGYEEDLIEHNSYEDANAN